jgi:hypothetical protein
MFGSSAKRHEINGQGGLWSQNLRGGYSSMSGLQFPPLFWKWGTCQLEEDCGEKSGLVETTLSHVQNHALTQGHNPRTYE